MRWEREGTHPTTEGAARVADLLRSINESIHAADIAVDDLDALASALEPIVARAAAVGGPQSWASDQHPDEEFSFRDASPMSGRTNAVAAPMTMSVDADGVVTGEITFGWGYEGPPGHVHGGFVAAAFDEVLGIAQATEGDAGMTGTISVRYQRPTPLNVPLRFVARHGGAEGRRITAVAELLDPDDNVLATSEAVFVSVDFDRFKQSP